MFSKFWSLPKTKPSQNTIDVTHKYYFSSKRLAFEYNLEFCTIERVSKIFT